jgi:hypothetical protein
LRRIDDAAVLDNESFHVLNHGLHG